MGNRGHAKLASEYLTGRDPSGDDDFKKACMTLHRNDAGITVKGFKNTADYDCTGEYGDRACYPTQRSSNLEYAAKRGNELRTL